MIKKLLSCSLLMGAFIFACTTGNNETKTEGTQEQESPEMTKEERKEEFGGKGIGVVKDVPLEETIDQEMVEKGKAIYEMKCASCHKLNDERVVGPGFSGITNRRTPEWIMNMITNVDVMLADDPQAQKLLEECLVRMPNQNVSVGDARDILEFMRQNDLETVGTKDEAAS